MIKVFVNQNLSGLVSLNFNYTSHTLTRNLHGKNIILHLQWLFAALNHQFKNNCSLPIRNNNFQNLHKFYV